MSRIDLLCWFAAVSIALLSPGAHAGGPLGVCYGQAIKYPGAGTITLNYDQGNLGSRLKATADAQVTSAVSLWTNVSTSTVTLARGADLPVDVTTANFLTYWNSFGDGLNPVIYDNDGTIIDTIFGPGASTNVLGVAGSAWSNNGSVCQYVEGRAVINGAIAVTNTTMAVTVAHEVGHLIGLDHTQLDGTQGLASANFPLMYPVAYRNSASLHEDDVAAVTALYPGATVNASYGTLTGTFITAAGTPILGANIWAQGSAGVFSNVSDYLMQNNGQFRLLLPPGIYTLRAETISTGFMGGSSVGPYSEDAAGASFQPPLYVGGVPISPVALGGGTPTQITITAGCSGSVTFRLDGTGGVSGTCSEPAPAAPTLIAPSGSITTTTPTYTWNASSGATSYYLLVQNTAGVVIGTTYTAASVGCGAGTGMCSVTPATALTNGSMYNWFVNASNSGGTSPWSAGNSITVNATVVTVPAVPATISPTGATPSTMPTYSWNASAGATSYYLLVQNTAGVAIGTTYSAASVGCGAGTGTCSVTPSTALTNGSSYNWFVNASNSAGTSAWSAARTITIGAAVTVPAAPMTIAPSGTITTTTPTYSWNASAGATSYYLLVQNTAGVAISQTYSAASVGCSAGTGTCSITPSTMLASGSAYNWFVNAGNSAGTSAWSAVTSISVNAAGPSVPAAPTLISPSGNLATATPTYSWNASAGATSYYLLVQNTMGVAIGQTYSAASMGCGAGTGTCSVTPSTALANGAAYNWFVNASNSLGTSAWSAGNGIVAP